MLTHLESYPTNCNFYMGNIPLVLIISLFCFTFFSYSSEDDQPKELGSTSSTTVNNEISVIEISPEDRQD